ncbi:predicted protein [Lichtheimia corymbifera JMRC:FSU:9682]|uniref:MULE transposase domain-containing protein n=1 Tax=Lichtheimia corymbifera JMRC:FSU:9682 TaxID=1263082 RepID=A0A068SGU4_9FUNG|nr:predicted protein [Lichtheimia corymbifera JMRC:FSU:9682]
MDLHDYLEARGYTIRYSIRDNVIDKLFTTHKVCIERAQRFPEVIIIDATYKTSLSKMPLVNVVGIDNISSNNSTLSLRSFYIASAVLTNETKVSYDWVLQCLKKVVYDNGRIKPGIFITDDDKGLRTALDIIYPDVPHTLCAWHIKKNFESHASGCYKKNTKKEEEFLDILDEMLYGRTSEVFDSGKEKYYGFVDKTNKSKELRDYLETLLSYRELWAGPWVEQHVHLGDFQAEYTYFRESTTFLTFKDEDGYTDSQMINALRPLQGKVVHFAIRHIKRQLRQAWYNEESSSSTTHSSDCTCPLRINYLLPCMHTLPKHFMDEIRLDTIHSRWLLQPNEVQFQPLPIQDVDCSQVDEDFSRVMEGLTDTYHNLDGTRRAELIESLEEINKDTTPIDVEGLMCPESVITKGRPKNTKGGRDPSRFERSQKEHDNLEQANKTSQPKKSSDDGKGKKRPNEDTDHQANEIYPDRKSYRNRISNVPDWVHPDIPHDAILSVINVKADGWCG